MKIAARITVLLLIAAALAQTASCAWFQKNEPKIICVGESTIADESELVVIVTTCAAISVSAANIVPCILAAAGSKWTEEVIACVANAQASQTPVVAPTGTGTSTQTSTTTATTLQGSSTQGSSTQGSSTQPFAIRASTTIKPENLTRLKAAVSAKWGSRLGSSPR